MVWLAALFFCPRGRPIQTFPDDYFYMGNRTQQYHQVGNAVPSYLAYQMGGGGRQGAWSKSKGLSLCKGVLFKDAR